MFKKFIFAAAIFALTSPANAVIVQTPAHRSADQNECLVQNPKNHQAYLECIKSKKGDKNKAEQPKAAEPAPAPSQQKYQ